MSEVKTSEAKTMDLSQINPESVSRYLRNNPDFFVDNPDILKEIQVPHASGVAVSLVEKQVSLLREQNEQIQRRLQEWIDIARQNEQLSRRMHTLVLTLMDADDPKQIFSALYDTLKQNFQVDHVSVRLFAEPAFIDTYAGVEFAGKDAPEQILFKVMITKQLPISGRLKRQQQVFLFGDDGDDIASAVIVPLHGKGWGGVLSIGSRDASRFTEAMGVEMLSNLGEILSYILKPWIVEE